MLTYIIAIFGAAALGGITLFALHLKKRQAPLGIAVVHGLVAATGLVLLLREVWVANAGRNLQIALGLFVVAALGGFVLFSYRFRGKPTPIGLIVVHALIAVSGFATLVAAVFL